jgi:hypothetical protein
MHDSGGFSGDSGGSFGGGQHGGQQGGDPNSYNDPAGYSGHPAEDWSPRASIGRSTHRWGVAAGVLILIVVITLVIIIDSVTHAH